jgi:hypothetical protein
MQWGKELWEGLWLGEEWLEGQWLEGQWWEGQWWEGQWWEEQWWGKQWGNGRPVDIQLSHRLDRSHLHSKCL